MPPSSPMKLPPTTTAAFASTLSRQRWRGHRTMCADKRFGHRPWRELANGLDRRPLPAIKPRTRFVGHRPKRLFAVLHQSDMTRALSSRLIFREVKYFAPRSGIHASGAVPARKSLETLGRS